MTPHVIRWRAKRHWLSRWHRGTGTTRVACGLPVRLRGRQVQVETLQRPTCRTCLKVAP